MATSERIEEDLRVVIITSEPKVKKPMTRALASMGWVIIPSSFDRATLVEHIKTRPDMYILDADGSEDDILWLLGHLREHQPDGLVLILAQNFGNSIIHELVAKQNLNNVIAKHGAITAFRDTVDEHELIATCHKIHTGDIFGIEKYIPTTGIRFHKREIHESADKEVVIGELTQFLRHIDCHSGLVPLITTVADELVTNGIFNAPRDAEGKAKYAHLNRKDNLILGPLETVTLRYVCDGRFVGLSVTDHFGSLAREIILRYLKQCLVGEGPEVEQKQGGAGIGLHMIFSSITQLIFNIDPGVKTEVIALFYVRGGVRAFKESGRSLNIFLTQ